MTSRRRRRRRRSSTPTTSSTPATTTTFGDLFNEEDVEPASSSWSRRTATGRSTRIPARLCLLAVLRMRHGFAAFAVVLSTLLVPIGITSTWLSLRVDSTEGYVDTVAPLADEPELRDALAKEVSAAASSAIADIVPGAGGVQRRHPHVDPRGRRERRLPGVLALGERQGAPGVPRDRPRARRGRGRRRVGLHRRRPAPRRGPRRPGRGAAGPGRAAVQPGAGAPGPRVRSREGAGRLPGAGLPGVVGAVAVDRARRARRHRYARRARSAPRRRRLRVRGRDSAASWSCC